MILLKWRRFTVYSDVMFVYAGSFSKLKCNKHTQYAIAKTLPRAHLRSFDGRQVVLITPYHLADGRRHERVSAFSEEPCYIQRASLQWCENAAATQRGLQREIARKSLGKELHGRPQATREDNSQGWHEQVSTIRTSSVFHSEFFILLSSESFGPVTGPDLRCRSDARPQVLQVFQQVSPYDEPPETSRENRQRRPRKPCAEFTLAFQSLEFAQSHSLIDLLLEQNSLVCNKLQRTNILAGTHSYISLYAIF